MARLERPNYISAYLKQGEGSLLKRLNLPTRDLWMRFSLVDSLQSISEPSLPCIEAELSDVTPYFNGHPPPKGYERCLVILRPAGGYRFQTTAKTPYMVNIAVGKSGSYIPLSGVQE